jgi:hypothetical protein
VLTKISTEEQSLMCRQIQYSAGNGWNIPFIYDNLMKAARHNGEDHTVINRYYRLIEWKIYASGIIFGQKSKQVYQTVTILSLFIKHYA